MLFVVLRVFLGDGGIKKREKKREKIKGRRDVEEVNEKRKERALTCASCETNKKQQEIAFFHKFFLRCASRCVEKDNIPIDS